VAVRIRAQITALVALVVLTTVPIVMSVVGNAAQASLPAQASPPGLTAAAVDPTIAGRAGITPGSQILWESDGDLGRDLDAIKASGAGWVGFDIDWPSIQGTNAQTFWWNATDRVVLAARQRGLSIWGGLNYAPTWARVAGCPSGTTHCFPTNAADYGRFASAAVQRYGANSSIPSLRGSITAWSIWNEPNHQEFSLPKPDPAKYVQMLQAAYPAIKAADPDATVITGGTAPAPDTADGTEISPETWLRDLYALGAKGYFDAVGHHPYMFPTNPLEPHPWNAFTQTIALHDVMVANGDGDKKIWGTEVGAPTGTASVALTEAQQAEWVRDYYLGWDTSYASFTGVLSWFQHRDSGTNPADYSDNMGLLRGNWVPKQSYGMYQAVMRGQGWNPPVAAYPGKRTVANPEGGYYVMGANGSVQAMGGAPWLGDVRLPANLARGLAVMPDGLGYAILDGYGGLHRFGTARYGVVGSAAPGYWRGWDIARDVDITPSGNGIAVMDAFGGMHRVGDAPPLNAGYWRGHKIARAFTYTKSGEGLYVLDGYGGVHVAGDAVRLSGGPNWRGWDIARDITLSATGAGYAILDGYGGVHPMGDAPVPGYNPAYARFDHSDGVAQIGKSYAVAS
jgi:polysaccharide biosynthesis protein PslG